MPFFIQSYPSFRHYLNSSHQCCCPKATGKIAKIICNTQESWPVSIIRLSNVTPPRTNMSSLTIKLHKFSSSNANGSRGLRLLHRPSTRPRLPLRDSPLSCHSRPRSRLEGSLNFQWMLSSLSPLVTGFSVGFTLVTKDGGGSNLVLRVWYDSAGAVESGVLLI